MDDTGAKNLGHSGEDAADIAADPATELNALRSVLIDDASSFAIALAQQVPRAHDGELITSLDAIAVARRALEASALVLIAEISARSVGTGRESLAHRLGDRTAAEVAARALGLEGAAAADLAIVASAVSARCSLLGEPLAAPLPALAEAIADATVSISAAATIIRTLDAVKHMIEDADRDGLTRSLVASAAELTPREFRRLCREVPAMLTPEDEEGRERALRAGTSLTISTLRDGRMRFVLETDPESGGLVVTALDARTTPQREVGFRDAEREPGADDPTVADAELTDPALADHRPLRQRRAEALVDLLRESIGRDAGAVAGVSVTMLVTVPLDVLQSGIGAAAIAGVDEPICAATARRLAADADIIPVVLGGDGEILDLGRSQRLFSRAQRRALAVRDGGCIWPGCQAPPGWCEVAHLKSWASGGLTDLINAALLCRFHHRRFDRDGWRLEHRDGERWLIPPPWIDASMRPRRIGPTRRVAANLRRRAAA